MNAPPVRDSGIPANETSTPGSKQGGRRAVPGLVAALLAVLVLIGGGGGTIALADPNPPAAADPCRDIGPLKRQAGGVAPKDTGERQLVRGSEAFGLDNLLKPAAKMLGLSKDLPEGELTPNVRLLDPSIQGEGEYNQKTQLQSGIVCALVDSLANRKIRRDLAQKIAVGLLATPTLLAGLEGPDVAALIQNGVACGVELAKTAAAAASASGSAGAAAAAAAPSAISAGPVCVAAGGDAARIFGKILNVWEHNPYFPQIVEFAAVLDPDTEIGAEWWGKLPEVFRSAELKGLLKAISRFNLKLSEVWIGKSIAIFGDAVSKSAAGDTSAVPGAAIAAVELGIQVISAAAYTLTGSDEIKFAGETIVDVKMLTNQMSQVYKGGLTRLEGEGSEVVAGGGLGGSKGTTQTLHTYQDPATAMQQLQQDYNADPKKQLGGATGCLMGSTQNAGTVLPQTVGATGAGFQQQLNAGYNTAARGGGPVLVPQNYVGQQCDTSQRVTVDKTKLLTQQDVDSVRAVPGTTKPKTPTDDPSGALFGIDGNNNPLSKIFGGGQGQQNGGGNTSIPGLPGIPQLPIPSIPQIPGLPGATAPVLVPAA